MPSSEFQEQAAQLRSRALAAAQAVWRVSNPEWFDPALRTTLRQKAAEVISAVAAVTILGGSEAGSDMVRAASAGAQELIRLAADLGLVSAENKDRLCQAYQDLADAVAVFEPPVMASIPAEPVTLKPLSSLAPANSTAESVRLEEATAASIPVAVNEQQAPAALLFNARQKKIIEHLQTVEHAQISDIVKLFDAIVSEKTIQRDLLQLVTAGIISRHGDNRWTTYSYNRGTAKAL